MHPMATLYPLYGLGQARLTPKDSKVSFYNQTKALGSGESGLVFCSCRGDTL